jgi:hypothetical protein
VLNTERIYAEQDTPDDFRAISQHDTHAPEFQAVIATLKGILSAYNRKDIDSHTDLYNVRYFESVELDHQYRSLESARILDERHTRQTVTADRDITAGEVVTADDVQPVNDDKKDTSQHDDKGISGRLYGDLPIDGDDKNDTPDTCPTCDGAGNVPGIKLAGCVGAVGHSNTGLCCCEYCRVSCSDCGPAPTEGPDHDPVAVTLSADEIVNAAKASRRAHKVGYDICEFEADRLNDLADEAERSAKKNLARAEKTHSDELRRMILEYAGQRKSAAAVYRKAAATIEALPEAGNTDADPEKGVIYRVVQLSGGRLFATDYKDRAALSLVHKLAGVEHGTHLRKELQGEPRLVDFIGPRHGGLGYQGRYIVRYESQAAYDILSR